MDALGVMRCYSCGAEGAADASWCPGCGADRALTAEREMAGLAYSLNGLPALVADGTLDGAAASRLHGALTARIAALRAGAPGRVAAGSELAAATTPGPGPEGAGAPVRVDGPAAPDLLLYAGAFLIVVAALLFVTVSGQQLSDPLRLALMAAGTGGSLAAGLVCGRSPRVVSAGRTFLTIGAVLVPIDIGASYVLFVRASPLERSELWLLGSLAAAGLYLALTLRGLGRWYARAAFLALASAALALAALLHLDHAAALLPLLALAAGAGAAAREGPRPLRPIAAMALDWAEVAVVTSLVALAGIVALEWRSAPTLERAAAVACVALAAPHYALRPPSSRSVGAAGLGGAAALGLLFVARAPDAAYGVAAVALSAAYLAAPRFGLGAPDGVRLAWAALAVPALLAPVEARDPALGAVAAFAAIPVLAALDRRGSPSPLPAPVVGLSLGHPAIALAAVALLVGVDWALLAAGAPGPFGTGLAARLFAGEALLVAIALAAARARHRWRDVLAASALAGAALVVALADDGRQRAAYAAAYAAVLGAVGSREPRAIAAAGGFAVVAGLALLPAPGAPPEVRAGAILVGSLIASASGLALARRAPRHARALRETALYGVALATWLGLDAGGRRVDRESAGWLVSALAVTAGAVLLAFEARLRGEPRAWLAASAAGLAALLMHVAHTGTADLELYLAPAGLYLVAAALAARRVPLARGRPELGLAELVGAALIMAPPYLHSWRPDGLGHGLRLIVELIVVLLVGVALQRRYLVSAAVSFMGLAATRALVDAAHRLPNWATFAVAGALLLALGFVLLVKRDAWLRAQGRLLGWWERWEVTERPAG